MAGASLGPLVPSSTAPTPPPPPLPPAAAPPVSASIGSIGTASIASSASASSSRNNLFDISWTPDIPPPLPLPPKPLNAGAAPSPASAGAGPGPSSFRSLRDKARWRQEVDDDFSPAPLSTSPSARTYAGTGVHDPPRQAALSSEPSGLSGREYGSSSTLGGQEDTGIGTTGSPRTSSFFDVHAFDRRPDLPSRPTTASITTNPSPLNLSRASSIRAPASLARSNDVPPPGPQPRRSPVDAIDAGALSPLHQSPTLPATSAEGFAKWQPPLPTSSEDIKLRLLTTSAYTLGEGRYATVYLAAYSKGKGRVGHLHVPESPTRLPETEAVGEGEHLSLDDNTNDDVEINATGDGYKGGSWRLCAAKILAPDRESQTMGLREAFFLNRLTNPAPQPGTPRGKRALSPLRSYFSNGGTTDPAGKGQQRRERSGRVYVIRLLAVKEDEDTRPARLSSAHGRSASDAVDLSRSSSRHRSTTLHGGSDPRYLPKLPVTDIRADTASNASLASSPSMPSLADAAKTSPAPSPARLVLLLEYASLGTLDRLLRTSPDLVGPELWSRWARQGAEALEWVHEKGVVHADVKPGNILLTATLDIRLSDFGSSLLIHPAHPPTDGIGLGTLPFSPPELVDPSRPFSFPVDTFAFGATLYQCLTGREPYRGMRSVEMMHHVRKGDLWVWEERTRLGLEIVHAPGGVSPYPSAWRHASSTASLDQTDALAAGLGAGVRRAGSLRLPGAGAAANAVQTARVVSDVRPRLDRMSSAESLRASEDVVDSSRSGDSPGGLKSWTNWAKHASGGAGSVPPTDAISILLSEGDDFPPSPVQSAFQSGSVSRKTSLRAPTSSRRTTVSSPSPLATGESASTSASGTPATPGTPGEAAILEPYSDGSPTMPFLNGQGRVEEGIRDILKAMLSPDPAERPTAGDIVRAWDRLGVTDDLL